MMMGNPLVASLGERVLGVKRYRTVARWAEQQDPRYRESMRRLRRFHNLHAGKRCFILGNGPSLNSTDLSLLKDELTFCSNRFYLMFDRPELRGFRPTYYVCANDLVVEQCAADIEQLSMPKFIGWHNRDHIRFTDDTTFLWTRGGLRSWFFTDLTEGCWEGSTVTMVAIQLAYYMGLSEVVLVGVDHSYQYNGNPHAEVTSQGHDPNHFAGDYFGKGFRWHLPDLEGSELSYRVAQFMFKQSGRRIVDATIGGKLDVFPKVDYASLFDACGLASAA
jgi:hypothetical protein